MGDKLSSRPATYALPAEASTVVTVRLVTASTVWDLSGLVGMLGRHVSAGIGLTALCPPAPWTTRAGSKAPDSGPHMCEKQQMLQDAGKSSSGRPNPNPMLARCAAGAGGGGAARPRGRAGGGRGGRARPPGGRQPRRAPPGAGRARARGAPSGRAAVRPAHVRTPNLPVQKSDQGESGRTRRRGPAEQPRSPPEPCPAPLWSSLCMRSRRAGHACRKRPILHNASSRQLR